MFKKIWGCPLYEISQYTFNYFTCWLVIIIEPQSWGTSINFLEQKPYIEVTFISHSFNLYVGQSLCLCWLCQNLVKIDTKHACWFICYLYQSPPGGTHLWVGYGCPARSFNHHPITKPEKMQICNLCPNHLFLEGPFFKPISTFYHVNWDA